MPVAACMPSAGISSVLAMEDQFQSSPDGIRIWRRPSEGPCSWRALCRLTQEPRVARSPCSPISSIWVEPADHPPASTSPRVSSNLVVFLPTISSGSGDEMRITITWRVLLLRVTSKHRLKRLFSNRVPVSMIRCSVVWARMFLFHWFLNLPVIVSRFHWTSRPLVLTMVLRRI